MPSAASDPAPLSLLGLTRDDEQIYRLVLRNSGATQAMLSELLGIPVPDVERRIQPLVESGLVLVESDVVSARPPEQALGRVISDESQRLSEMTQQLESLRSQLPALTAEHRAAQSSTGAPVQVQAVEGDVVALVKSLSSASTGDLMWLRPDQWRLPVGAEIDEWVQQLVRSGRRSRAIYPARVLEEAPDVVRARAEAGEYVRILASVPCRISIMGSHAALIPDRWGMNTGRRLVVREESLVGALTALFEGLWERAMSIPGLDGQSDLGDRGGDRSLLLDQLAAGVKDEQIARALGLSLRTVRRRVADVLDELGVESRFQAGVEAVRRGWI